MNRARRAQPPPPACEVIDFGEALLNACEPDERAELLAEAELVASAFAPQRRARQLEQIARSLAAGARDAEIGRAHARKLAAAIRLLAKKA